MNTIPCDSDVTVTASGPISHLCPYKDETDHGRIAIRWAVYGQTFELHSLADYIAKWADTRLSHEQVTDRIRHDLSTTEGVTDVQVDTSWDTAGFAVSVTTGGESDSLPGKPVRAEGGASNG
jgi:NADPH-dependent 7-cyano-7-deazaguanine reductase QueF